MITLFENFNKYKDVKELLSKGKWNTINFLVKSDDDESKVIKFLNEIGIGSLDVINENDSVCFTIFTNKTPNFDAFRLYTSGDGSHMVSGSFASWNPSATISPLLSIDEFINYVNSLIIPSYEPRKIERTLESMKFYPYRFKTEKEFIDTFGEDWRDVITDRGPNWADGGMDHLFGKVFPFDKSKLNSKDNDYPINGRWYDPETSKSWMIGWDMLISRLPSYKPKKINRDI